MLGIRMQSHGCLIMSGWHVCRLGPLTDLCRSSNSMLYLQFLLSLDSGYLQQTNKKLLAQFLRMELRVLVPVKAADHSFFSCDNSCALGDQYELTRHSHNLEFWPIMNGFTMSTVFRIKASFCCVIGLDVNKL